MDYRNDKFQVGDIVRYIKDNQIVGRICNAVRRCAVATSDRWDETYYWTEYFFADGYMFTEYDDDKYELISKEIGPDQIKDYDKILVCNGTGLEGDGYWKCDFAAGWTNESNYYEKRLMTISQPDVKNTYYNILPYNSETKKLVGTNLCMPNYYHYSIWIEDRIKNIKDYPYDWIGIEDNIRNIIKYK
jgi:hypothetical protein